MSTRFQEVVQRIREEQNPANEFLSVYGSKTAASFDSVKGMMSRGASQFGRAIGRTATDAAGGALALAAVSAIAAGGEKAYSAMTRERDFKRMLASNPHLHADYHQDPARFNMAYNSLRSMNREFSADPFVAGAYMNQIALSPQGGSLLAEKVYFPMRKNPDQLRDAVLDLAGKAHLSGSQLRHQNENQLGQMGRDFQFRSRQQRADHAFKDDQRKAQESHDRGMQYRRERAAEELEGFKYQLNHP